MFILSVDIGSDENGKRSFLQNLTSAEATLSHRTGGGTQLNQAMSQSLQQSNVARGTTTMANSKFNVFVDATKEDHLDGRWCLLVYFIYYCLLSFLIHSMMRCITW